MWSVGRIGEAVQERIWLAGRDNGEFLRDSSVLLEGCDDVCDGLCHDRDHGLRMHKMTKNKGRQVQLFELKKAVFS